MTEQEKQRKKKGSIPPPEGYWTGYESHNPKITCFYCMGERANINIKGTVYPPIGADGATIVICNTLHL